MYRFHKKTDYGCLAQTRGHICAVKASLMCFLLGCVQVLSFYDSVTQIRVLAFGKMLLVLEMLDQVLCSVEYWDYKT